MRSLRSVPLLVAVMCLLGGLAAAQDQDDPPSRVARVQFLEGQVSMQPGGVSDWIEAPMNRPLTTADRVWIDRNSRAELSLATTSLMLGAETSMTLLNLSDQMAQIELDQGTLILSVRYLAPGEVVEVDTPNFAFTAFKSGVYRFYVEPDDDRSSVMVRREGDGEASGNGEPVHLHDGYYAMFTNGQSLNYEVRDLPGRDWLDDWAASSERQAQQSASARYVPAGTVGYESLDGNGQWVSSPMYGTVWYPNVGPGWAPYRYGHWAWIEPWGWTWVDDAPWGFAPFHYGRWVNDRGRWAWIPGPVGVRPVYAPAMVAWVGGVGAGVAWVPLGWHDPYIPAYHVSPVYARNVNISNSKVVNVTVINNYYSTTNVTVRNTTINNIRYENTTVNGAVTGASANAVASGRPMSQVGTAVSANAAAHASVMATASVAPTHESVLGGHPPAVAPARIAAPRVIAAKTQPPPPPVKFEQQREMLQRNNGMPLSPQVRTSLQASSPAPAQHVVVSGQPNRPNTYRPPASNVPVNTQVQPNRPVQPNQQTQPYSQPRVNQPATQPSVPRPPQQQVQPTAPAQGQVQQNTPAKPRVNENVREENTSTQPPPSQPPTQAPRPAQPQVQQQPAVQPHNAQPAPPAAQPNQQKKQVPKPSKEEKEKEKEHEHSR